MRTTCMAFRLLCRLLSVFACATVLLTTGCTPAAKIPELGKVTGTVKLDGSVVEGVVVIFEPLAGGAISMGTTDAHGKYKLWYDQKNQGAVLGEHRVRMMYNGLGLSGSGQTTNGVPDDTEENAVAWTLAAGQLAPVFEKYGPNSPFRSIVKTGENSGVDFNLTSKKQRP